MMFWLCGQIAPDLDTMQVGFPYVMPLLMKRQSEIVAAQEKAEKESAGVAPAEAEAEVEAPLLRSG